MFKNYFLIAWRNLKKNKIFSAINILGLTIGITCCMMIFLYLMNEFSVDKFHKKGKDIYRVMRGFDINEGSIQRVPYLSPPYGTALLNDYASDIKSMVRVMPSNGLVTVGTKAFNEPKIYITDDAFFTMFSFPLIKGDAATALKEPGSIVITERVAKKYFGSEEPLGRLMEVDKQYQLKVTAIARDIPSNSTLDFDMVMPISNFKNEPWFPIWINNNLFTYIELNKNSDPRALESKFPQFMEKYMSKDMARLGSKSDLALTPLRDIYFESSTLFDNVKHGDKKVVFIFLSIAVLILVIACINFINLSTIRAVERSKEVGLRKVLGALRNNLIWQFIGESILLTLISCTLSVGLLQLLIPFYNGLLGYQLNVSWSSPAMYLFLFGIIIVVGFLAGSYPALFLSAFSPIQALKGKLRLGKGGSFFRQTLVVVQFSISVFLIIGTIIIMNQMNYIKTRELGFNKEFSIVVPLNNGPIYRNRNSFKRELESKPNVMAVSTMSGEPGGFHDVQTFEVEGKGEQVLKFRSQFTDFEWAKTLGLKIVAGRDFSSSYPTDSTDAVLVNQTALPLLGFTAETAIGKWVKNTVRDTVRRKIIGVVQDFNFLSLKEPMGPLIVEPSDDNRVAVIRMKPGNAQAALETAKKAYTAAAPLYPFEYNFLDQKFDLAYKDDVQQQTIISLFSGLAIFIACLGLFGLASFTATKRNKEIGVRKVLGSSTKGIVILLSKELMKPVLIATLIAVPVGYYVMNSWLQNFAYRLPLQWWAFAIAALLAGLIALATVSYQAIKAALNNPVKSLRSE